jgi:D-alanyl-D-alanine carboxypeptidase
MLNIPPEISIEYRDRVRSVLESLGISLELVAARSLVLCEEARDLVTAEVGGGGREHRLLPAAADAWHAMKLAASSDGVTLEIVSAFRSVDRQAEIIRRKLDGGLSLSQILSANAPPGFSEHHTGRAIDVTTAGSRPLERDFEGTAAFQWLSRRAGSFGFTLSYPLNNPHGYMYEPWHWCLRARDNEG